MSFFPGGSEVKASAYNVGDPSSIPGWGRSPGGGHGNPLQYSCLENPMEVFIPIPKKGNSKECSNYRTIALISHASKVMLKMFQARLQHSVNHELPDVQAGDLERQRNQRLN